MTIRNSVFGLLLVAGFASWASSQSLADYGDFDDDSPSFSVRASTGEIRAAAQAGGGVWIVGIPGSVHRVQVQSPQTDPLAITFLPPQRLVVLWADTPISGRLVEYDYSAGSLSVYSDSVLPLPPGVRSARLAYDARSDRVHLSTWPAVTYQFSSKIEGGSIAGAAWHDGQAVFAYDFIQFAGFPLGFRSIRFVGQTFDRLAISSSDPYHEEVLVIDEDPNGIVSWTRHSIVTPLAQDYVTFSRGDVREGQTQVRVLGFHPTSGTVVSDDGSTLGSYQMTSGQVESLVLLSRALIIGETVSLISASGEVFESEPVVARLGAPNTTSSGTSFYPLRRPLNHYLGNANFQVASTLSLGTFAPGWSQMLGAGIVGFHQRGPFGVDPVVLAPEGLILDPLTSLVIPLNVTIQGYTGRMSVTIPTPTNSALVGQVFFYQFLMSDGAEIAISDIVGFPLLPGSP